MDEAGEFARVRERVNELMSGGPFGDGIGPGNTAYQINDEFGTTYCGEEIWRIWRQGKEWANPKDDVYPI
jgi:hypothetical protein